MVAEWLLPKFGCNHPAWHTCQSMCGVAWPMPTAWAARVRSSRNAMVGEQELRPHRNYVIVSPSELANYKITDIPHLTTDLTDGGHM